MIHKTSNLSIEVNVWINDQYAIDNGQWAIDNQCCLVKALSVLSVVEGSKGLSIKC
jgi:hypothetical protein